MRAFASLAAIVVLSLATACNNEPNPSLDIPACDVAAPEVIQTDGAACLQFREALCGLMDRCDAFLQTADCNAWFTQNYGDCEKDPAKDQLLDDVKAHALKICLEYEIPEAHCGWLQEKGIEAEAPNCGLFLCRNPLQQTKDPETNKKTWCCPSDDGQVCQPVDLGDTCMVPYPA